MKRGLKCTYCVLLSSASKLLCLRPEIIFFHTCERTWAIFSSSFLQSGCRFFLSSARLLYNPQTLGLRLKGFGMRNALWEKRASKLQTGCTSAWERYALNCWREELQHPGIFPISFFFCFLSDILGVPSPCAHCGLQWTENETCFSWSLLLLTCYLTPCLTSLKYLVFKMSNLLFLSVHMLCFHLLIIFADCRARENWRNNMLEGLLYIGCCWVFQHINNWLRSLKF